MTRFSAYGRAWAGCALLLLALAGCSGDDDGDSGSGSGLSVSPSSLTFGATHLGAIPTSQALSVDVTAADAAYLAVGYPDTEPAWLTLSVLSWANPVLINVAVNTTSLAAGTYSATVRVVIARQNESIIGYRDVPVTYTVARATLVAAPASLSFTQVVAGAAPPVKTLALSAGADSYPWTATVQYTDGAGWLRVDGGATASGTSLPASLDVSVVGASGMAAGTYAARVLLTGAGRTIQVPVSLEVRPPTLTAPAAVAFQAVAGGDPPPGAAIEVGSEAGTIPFTTSVVYGPTASDWLMEGESGTAPVTLTLFAHRTLLPAGTHTATVTLTPTNGAAPVDVEVSYTLTASQLGLSPASLTFSVDPTTLPAALSQSLDVTDTGAELAWTVQSSAPWVSVTPSSGNTGASVSVALDESLVEELPNGSHTATLTFTSNGPSVTNATRTLTVSLELDLPLVSQVAPYVAHVGEAKPVVLRGQGFASLASPEVDFGGSAGTAVSVVSDRELRVTPPATLTQGSHAVRITNGNLLALERSTARLVVVPAPVHTAGLISSAGTRQRVIYDAERACLYAANEAANAIQRWCDSGGAWNASSLAVTRVRDVALMPGGEQLLAIGPDTLHRIDLASFTSVGSMTAAQLGITLGYYDSLRSLVVTNDGRALILAGYQWLSLYRYDPGAAGTATRLVSSGLYNGGLSTIMAASLDGDRVVTGESGISPGSNFLSYDATDGTWTQPATEASVYSVSLDRTGTRIGAAGTVYTGAFVPMAYAGNWRMTVSPGGTRAYGYVPFPSPVLHTYDISGLPVTELGTGTTPAENPGSGTQASPASNQLLTSLDGGTLFIDGTNGILVMPAP